MRVLLIYTNQSRELIPAPPIGLSYIASATAAAGHEVDLLDLAFSEHLHDDLRAAVARFVPDVVGLSVRNVDNVIQQRYESPLAELRRQIALINQTTQAVCGKAVPLVLGGPAISILGERTLDVFGVDYAVVGEGEDAFPALLHALEHGYSAAGIAGVSCREQGRVISEPLARIPSFGGSGMQAWVDWSRYQTLGGTWPIQTKRGCPLKCSYCSYPLIEGERFRKREPGDVVDEIEQVLRDVGPQTFEIVDATFNLPPSHAIAVCEEIIRRGVKADFTAMGVNPIEVPPELFPTMKRAGFNSVMITPEAANDTMLGSLGKGFDKAVVQRCRDLVADSGLSSMWFFMLGGLGETMDTVEETIRFAEEQLNGPQFMAVVFLGIRVLPDTRLAAELIARGEIAADTDLSQGVFYNSPMVDQKAVIARINRAIENNPSIAHATEASPTGTQAMLFRKLHRQHAAPPFWRYLPEMLREEPLRGLRNRHPAVV